MPQPWPPQRQYCKRYTALRGAQTSILGPMRFPQAQADKRETEYGIERAVCELLRPFGITCPISAAKATYLSPAYGDNIAKHSRRVNVSCASKTPQSFLQLVGRLTVGIFSVCQLSNARSALSIRVISSSTLRKLCRAFFSIHSSSPCQLAF